MTTPPTGLRARFKAAMAEAEAKANAMSQEELDAKLGPATRMVFAAGERLESSAQRAAATAAWGMATALLFIWAGWMWGRAHAQFSPSPATDLALAVGLGLGVFAFVRALRQRGVDTGYLAAFLGAVAASAGSGGDIATIAVAGAGVAAAGLSALLTPMPAPEGAAQR